MIPIDKVADAELYGVRYVLTDMDETLTYQGKLSADTYASLERLQHAGIKVIPVTAAPAGWCDLMARMWPVAGVIAENGGVFLHPSASGHHIERHYWHEKEHQLKSKALDDVLQEIKRSLPWVAIADDQCFRLTSIAFYIPETEGQRDLLIKTLQRHHCSYTINNLWVLGWMGDYNKLSMSRRVLMSFYGMKPENELEQVYYSGDSLNDAPMFGYYRNTLGMSSIYDVIDEIPAKPRWISHYPGGKGFVEGANKIINAQKKK